MSASPTGASALGRRRHSSPPPPFGQKHNVTRSGGPDGHEWVHDLRQTAIRTIERYRRGEKGASKLEQYDHEQAAPVIRVLYGSTPLPIFDGKPAAVIDPSADRDALWNAIIEKLREGAYDAEIEQVSRQMVENLNLARKKRFRQAA